MTKLLQRRFVFTAMTAITLLILIIVGGINIFNFRSQMLHVQENLKIISDAHGDPERVPRPPSPETNDIRRKAPPDTSIKMKPNQYDTFMSLNFFVVRLSATGSIVSTDVRRTSTITEEDAAALVSDVVSAGNIEGRNGRYCYRVSTDTDDTKSIVFLDITNSVHFAVTVFAISSAIGIICWGLMLLVTVLLSKKAIKPFAENIEKQKQFVTDAGHEIKTPLAIIMSNTEAMELYIGENKWSRNIKEQTDRLSMLMKELLSLAQMDEKTEHKVLYDVDFSRCVCKTVESYSQFIEDKQIRCETEITEKIVIKAIQTDCEKLCFILLDNAVKYTDDCGSIRISLGEVDNHTVFAVENSCSKLPNVPPEKLFDRFYRSDMARTQETGGYGIGLSMAKTICSSYGWKIKGEYISESKVRFEILINME